MVREECKRAGEATHAIPLHRPADVCSPPEAQPRKGEEDTGTPRCRKQELLERHRQTRLVLFFYSHL